MKIAIASDHAGFRLKTDLAQWLAAQGHTVHDFGTTSEEPVDYPDFAKKVADAVSEKKSERGIVICGSGVGASVAANKVKGIRACVCHDTYSAHQGVEHDDMNVLVLGSRVIGESLAQELLNAFLKAQFSNEERHVRRLNKVLAMENAWR
ncbi:MAG TPA: ribose 5-phosphate isomerase B [Myxococcota bacterium]|nr:ribose 5-phosphate isomerase B [Myxococcota bacterium]